MAWYIADNCRVSKCFCNVNHLKITDNVAHDGATSYRPPKEDERRGWMGVERDNLERRSLLPGGSESTTTNDQSQFVTLFGSSLLEDRFELDLN